MELQVTPEQELRALMVLVTVKELQVVSLEQESKGPMAMVTEIVKEIQWNPH